MRESPELDDLAYERQRQRRTEAQSRSGLGLRGEIARKDEEIARLLKLIGTLTQDSSELRTRIDNLRQRLTTLGPIVAQATALARTVENFYESTAPRQASNKQEEREGRLYGR